MPSRLIAASCALTAFAVAVVSGLAAGNGAARVLGQAIVSMAVCHALGLALAWVAERALREHWEQAQAGA